MAKETVIVERSKTSKKRQKREKKAWWKQTPELERITRHIGKHIDNLKSEDILNYIGAAICAAGGYTATKNLGADDITALTTGAPLGLIAYQLVKAPNLIAGASGAAILAGLGIINIYNPLANVFQIKIFEGITEELGKLTETVKPKPVVEQLEKTGRVDWWTWVTNWPAWFGWLPLPVTPYVRP